MAKLPAQTTSRPGRPPATTRDELATLALELFVREGFDETSLTDIAEAAGISRRTVLRYYASKADIVWGAFSEHLDSFRANLAASDPDEQILDVVRREVIAFNDYGDAEIPTLRARMALITSVPALQGRAMVRHADWCAVISDFVGHRFGISADDLAPQLVANVALAVALTGYREWIADDNLDLLVELDRGFSLLGTALADDALRAPKR